MKNRLDFWESLPPALSKEENLRLLREYSKSRDENLRERIFDGNLRFVCMCVTRYCKKYLHYQSSIYPENEDLLEEGAWALLRAIDLFNAELGTSFSSYLSKAVKNSIGRFVVGEDSSVRVTRSLDAPMDEDERSTFLAMLFDFDYLNYEDKVAVEIIKKEILPKLPEAERQVFVDYFFKNKTLQKIANEKNCSREAIRKRLKMAKFHTKNLFETGELNDVATETPKKRVHWREKFDIEKYGKDFFEKYFVHTLTDRQRFIFERAILAEERGKLVDIARELNEKNNNTASSLRDVYFKLEKYGDIYYEKYLRGEEPSKEKIVVEKKKKSLGKVEKMKKFVASVGGEEAIRHYFLPYLKDKRNALVLEYGILGYNGETQRELAKKCGLCETEYSHRIARLKKYLEKERENTIHSKILGEREKEER